MKENKAPRKNRCRVSTTDMESAITIKTELFERTAFTIANSWQIFIQSNARLKGLNQTNFYSS